MLNWGQVLPGADCGLQPVGLDQKGIMPRRGEAGFGLEIDHPGRVWNALPIPLTPHRCPVMRIEFCC